MNAGTYDATFPTHPLGYQPMQPMRQATQYRNVTGLRRMRARGEFRMRGLGQTNEFAGPGESTLPQGQAIPSSGRADVVDQVEPTMRPACKKCGLHPFWLLTGIGGLISIPILVFSKTRG